MKEKITLYKILFVHHNKLVGLYVEQIFQSDIFGFIEIEGFVFNHNKGLVVNPAEENLRQEFEKVKRSFIPMQNILRIDEVSEQGEFRVAEFKKEDSKQGNSSLFPFAHNFPIHPQSDS